MQCNNPLTKEPKLKSAMRIVPEWKDYDEEIKRLQEKFSLQQDGVTGMHTDEQQQNHIHKEL